ncbi:hypothetical protein [Marilutibacter chinensis]|uniref:Ankyrin repeat protein n=1 Tax=Marilutibacter chinensis TaxID=2912247 RepID=A0ABS9HSC5_9GAMM|nr:hypothetical protein [Lysobacter chinensis]MCF7221027.1 hypothetical protein [Lysobacter chinensis]
MTNTDLLAAIQQCNPALVAAAIGRGAQPNAHDAPVATRRSTSPCSPLTHRPFGRCWTTELIRW